MAAVTAPAAAAAAADDDAGGVTTGGARRGGRTRAVGRGRGVVGPHGEVLMGRGKSRCTQGCAKSVYLSIFSYLGDLFRHRKIAFLTHVLDSLLKRGLTHP